MTEATTYYAIGDVHGMDEMLEALHAAIFEDIAAHASPAKIVHLGDYVDRGPSSWQVVERLIGLQEANPDVICLTGNHEEMMVNAVKYGGFETVRHWTGNGGFQTIDSYGGRMEDIPEAHIEWMAHLPYLHLAKEIKVAFVHAGVEPDDFPKVEREIALWTRSRRFFGVQGWRGTPLANWIVVHGHTPTLSGPEAWTDWPRINIDTGACFQRPTSKLTCARITPNRKVRLLSVDASLKPEWGETICAAQTHGLS